MNDTIFHLGCRQTGTLLTKNAAHRQPCQILLALYARLNCDGLSTVQGRDLFYRSSWEGPLVCQSDLLQLTSKRPAAVMLLFHLQPVRLFSFL